MGVGILIYDRQTFASTRANNTERQKDASASLYLLNMCVYAGFCVCVCVYAGVCAFVCMWVTVI